MNVKTSPIDLCSAMVSFCLMICSTFLLFFKLLAWACPAYRPLKVELTRFLTYCVCTKWNIHPPVQHLET